MTTRALLLVALVYVTVMYLNETARADEMRDRARECNESLLSLVVSSDEHIDALNSFLGVK